MKEKLLEILVCPRYKNIRSSCRCEREKIMKIREGI